MQWQTARLTLGPLDETMAERLSALSREAACRRFLPDEVFETPQEAAQAIRQLTAGYGREGFPQVYAVSLTGGALIGHVELAPIDEGWEIGYHIGQSHTGNGYAVEAVNAFAPAMMAALGLRVLYGVCDAQNIASRRVLEKTGFQLLFEGEGPYQGRVIPLRRYGRMRIE
ncbi:MAG: GNAT family N-acetyltransferase [Eubacteriales bacterium]|nr:GNAT family N-acetyltransferase [Eubacteriales bacterium]